MDRHEGEFDDDLVAELRDGLRPRSAPAGFSARTMARLRREEPEAMPLGPTLLHWPVWRFAAAAILICAVALGSFARQRERRMAGERARAQVLLALRITGQTLQAVNEKVNGQETGKDEQP